MRLIHDRMVLQLESIGSSGAAYRRIEIRCLTTSMLKIARTPSKIINTGLLWTNASQPPAASIRMSDWRADRSRIGARINPINNNTVGNFSFDISQPISPNTNIICTSKSEPRIA
jgi:hypothetical protein